MSTYNYEKKLEYERNALAALSKNDTATAFDCIVLAAKFSHALALECSGVIAEAYLKNAEELLNSAEKLHKQLNQNTKTNSGTENNGNANTNQARKVHSKTKLADVFGMEEAKSLVKLNIIEPLKNPEEASKYGLTLGGGLLLYGLPGTGKTYFAKAIAGELDMPFYEMRPSEILSKWVGESPQKMQAFFDEARSNPMSIIFIDEIDELLSPRENAHQVTQQVTNVLLREFTETEKNPFFLIGATNYPDRLDDAALSRFKSNCLEVELPNEQARRFIFEREFAREKAQIPVDPAAIDFLVKKTEGFSSRDIVGAADRLIGMAFIDKIDKYTLEFCEKYFKDTHITSKEVQESILRFQARMGIQGEKKKVINKTVTSLKNNRDDNDLQVASASADDKGTPPPSKPDAGTPAATPTPAPAAPAKPVEQKDPSKITFADVKGLTKAKEIVKDALINPARYPEVYKNMGVIPSTGLLLFGPPGTGKTMFARAIANELDTEFISVSLTDIKGKNPLQTVSMISSVFAKARTAPKGAVLFIDDCEEILSRPGNSKAYGVSQFLNEMDGLKKTGNSGKVFILIATNRPWMIDGALLRSGRVGASVYVGLPEFETRKELITAALADVILAADVDIDELAEMTEGYSCAEIYHGVNGGGICNLARNYASKRWVKRIEENPEDKNRMEPVCFDDLVKAMQEVIPTAVRDAERIARNEQYRDMISNTNQNALEGKSDFAYSISDENEISFSTPDAEELKDIVFSSKTIQDTEDYRKVAESTYFIYNDKYRDKLTFNAYASTALYVMKRYNLTDPELTENPARPVIVLYDGFNIANTAMAAIFLKQYPDLVIDDPAKLHDFLISMCEHLMKRNGKFGVPQLKAMDKKYDLFPDDEKALENIKILASAMTSFTIAHELGHIVYGDIFKFNTDDNIYSRNMERSADQFAADIINGIADEGIRNLFFLGAALSFINELAWTDVAKSPDEDVEASTHPGTIERFCNLIKNYPEYAKKHNLTEETFKKCIP